eukprot:symbB.v1.2.018796.t1/scaffold1515.1/size114345/4
MHSFLLLASILSSVDAASHCAKSAGCRNLLGGDQTRPILTGLQSFTSRDGTCEYGHVAQGGFDCKPGPSCGETLFDCTCISQKVAFENSIGARNSRFLFGGASALVAVSILLCAWLWKRGSQPSKVLPSSMPVILGQPQQGPFTGVCVEGPIIAEDPAKIQQRRSCDCLTILLLIFLPGSLFIAGAAIFASGIGIHVGEYYNGCRI